MEKVALVVENWLFGNPSIYKYEEHELFLLAPQ